jgi:hypothetical protein
MTPPPGAGVYSQCSSSSSAREGTLAAGPIQVVLDEGGPGRPRVVVNLPPGMTLTEFKARARAAEAAGHTVAELLAEFAGEATQATGTRFGLMVEADGEVIPGGQQ